MPMVPPSTPKVTFTLFSKSGRSYNINTNEALKHNLADAASPSKNNDGTSSNLKSTETIIKYVK